ncbi:hypothetical protein [Rummeliibacillus stabekisii]|nr:hypothetical protein [Rummeliibacillus stabekisii]
MTEEEFDSLPERKQNDLIDGSINWHETMKNAEIDEIEIWDVFDR